MRLSLITLTILFIATAALAQKVFPTPTSLSKPDPTTIDEASRIWEAAVQAKGGREKLRAVKNIQVYTEHDSRGSWGKKITRHGSALVVLPDQTWSYTEGSAPFGNMVSMVNYGNSTSYFGNVGRIYSAKPMERPEKPYHLFVLSLMLETAWLKPTIVGRDWTVVDGRSAVLIQTVVDGQRTDFAFDSAFNLVEITTYTPADEPDRFWPSRLDLREYVTVAGLRVPSSQQDIDLITGKGPVERLRVSFNVDYDPTIFEMLPAAANIDSWRSKH